MNANTLKAVTEHGELLLAIFPNSTEQNPVALCKKLRRLEAQAMKHTLELCNGDEPGEHGEEWQGRHNNALFMILNRINVLLGNTTDKPPTVPVFINRDPRGYALKIDDEWMRQNMWTLNNGNRHTNGSGNISVARLHRDLGGYGIIAPDLTVEEKERNAA
jgi:hypothetical protein